MLTDELPAPPDALSVRFGPGQAAVFELDPSTCWADAFRLWLESRRAASTQRAYRKAYTDLLSFTGKAPWQIGKADMAAWVEAQRTAGLSPETIHQRLAAVSSFYTYVTSVYTLPSLNGREQPLHHYNPVATVPRPRVTPFDKAKYLTPDQARSFLRAIPQNSLQGLRDYALFLAYLATGRRNSEIRLLRWADIEPENAPLYGESRTTRLLSRLKVSYRWSGKGKSRRDECPLPVYQAIIVYLKAAGRLETIAPGDYIFTALNNNARNLHRERQHSDVTRDTWHLTPLTACMVGRLVKKYARLAGLSPERITVHTLRHTAAMLRKEAGESLEDISNLLGHSSISTTQIYLHTMEGRPDITWHYVEALLGLPHIPDPAVEADRRCEASGRVDPDEPPRRRRLRVQYR